MNIISQALLPEGFEDLLAYLDWALPTQNERGAKRRSSSMAECKAFYEAMAPRMEDLISHLEQFPRNVTLDAANDRLFKLGLAYMDVAIPIDSGWQSTVNENSFDASRINMAEHP